MSEDQQARREGVKAFHKNQPVESNPYPKEDARHTAWLNGYWYVYNLIESLE